MAKRFAALPRLGRALLLLAPALGCVRAPVPRFIPLAAAEAATVLPLPRPPSARVQGYLADGRLTSLAHGERLRAPLRLLVQRPDKLRISVLAPQGAAAWVLACDGEAITSLDVGHGTFRALPADRNGLRALAPQLDFGLSPQLLVALLFGEAVPPRDARLAVSPEALRFAWPEGGVDWTAEFGRNDGRLLRLQGERKAAGLARAPDVEVNLDPPARVSAEVQRWSTEGLPMRLTLRASAAGDAAGKPGKHEAQVLEVEFDRVDANPSVRAGAFEVRP